MTTLREAAQMALEACEQFTAKELTFGQRYTNEGQKLLDAITALRTALAEQPAERKPLTDEQIEQAYREIWRNVPSDFTHTTHDWIEQGIKYAERAHGIGEQE